MDSHQYLSTQTQRALDPILIPSQLRHQDFRPHQRYLQGWLQGMCPDGAMAGVSRFLLGTVAGR